MHRSIPVLVGSISLACLGIMCASPPPRGPRGAAAQLSVQPTPPAFDVTTSVACKSCHEAIYAEHRQNTHGRAFFDEEARLATRGFRREDCVRCHTPRPVFETGIGMTPMQRWTDLEEGNTCFSCHGRAGYDYGHFAGGAECKVAFEPRVGEVEHCASCHRIAGTPDQWSRAENGKSAGNVCLDCHMPRVQRPVAEGEPPRMVRSHVFPASRSESQLRRAYGYEAKIEGDEVVVAVTNKGAGHNFPTANRQRAVESLVIVRDRDGNEVSRSRMTCRYPYVTELEPHQLTMPKSSQIPSGKTSEHRVPLHVDAGTVECRLYFKTYRPIEDAHPTLSHCLEERRLPFSGVTPSTKPVDEAPEVRYPAPESDLNDFFNPAGLVNIHRPPPGPKPIEIPQGRTPEDALRLAALLESHLPEARKRARERLVEIFPDSAPALVRALGHWSNETFNEAMRTFVAIGDRAAPTLAAALDSDALYVRCHAKMTLARLGFPGDRAAWCAALERGLKMENPLDRRFSADALGELGLADAATALRPLLEDADPDVVAATARALDAIGDRTAVPAIERALVRSRWIETRRDLALALAGLGSSAGLEKLIDDLDDADVLQRELSFSVFFAITGVHLGYEPNAPVAERLEAIARLESWREKTGGPVRAPRRVDSRTREATAELVTTLGGGTDTEPGGDDERLLADLVAYGRDAVPALVEGLTYPSGFWQKRALVCQALGKIKSREAAPFLAATLRDPVPDVTEWACWALELVRDPETLPQVRRYQNRAASIVRWDRGIGEDAPADKLVARAARTRLMLGDEAARTDLVNMLLSPGASARRIAIGALTEKYGDDRGYDPDADASARIEAAARWTP